ncbi:metal ABC transporter permease [Thermogemmata fonticola]|jgi:manganese/zinc/iron transport system permease protein|uniref:metal ABC transporter permease n=1 Tax=Thermogemmata fonticola TaxID=2755323 RepID=UPI001E623009|nr:metal ABC transporter permease [Thermogemmata fonticola]
MLELKLAPELELACVLAVAAAACALPGVFLVLRRMALVSDAIGHTLLFGIVVAFFVVGDLDSPFLLLGAALTGLATVVLVESLQRHRRMKADAAIGLVFPFLFALAVALVSLGARNIHLDVDAVLVGQPEYALLPRWHWRGIAIPPVAVLGGVVVLNLLLCLLFYKELKLTTFDPELARVLGYSPALVHYGLMAVVSVTAVAVFDAVGPVLVVGYFVLPAATGLLLSQRLSGVLVWSVGVGVIGSILGTLAAARWNTNAAGSVAAALGLLLVLAFLLSPYRGWLVQLWRRRHQRQTLEEILLLVHLYQHEGTAAEATEAAVADLHQHLDWPDERVAQVIARTLSRGYVQQDGNLLRLTPEGRQQAQQVYGNIRGLPEN